MLDAFETANGFDPLDPADASQDADSDGFNNLQEFLAGTDPQDPNSKPDGQDELIIDFGPGIGLWVRRNDSSWAKLHSLSPEAMATGDMDGNGQDEVIIDFGPGIGLWVRRNDSSWAKLHSLSPEAMVSGNMDGI